MPTGRWQCSRPTARHMVCVSMTRDSTQCTHNAGWKAILRQSPLLARQFLWQTQQFALSRALRTCAQWQGLHQGLRRRDAHGVPPGLQSPARRHSRRWSGRSGPLWTPASGASASRTSCTPGCSTSTSHGRRKHIDIMSIPGARTCSRGTVCSDGAACSRARIVHCAN